MASCWDTESYGTQTATQKQFTFWCTAHSCVSSRRTRIWACVPPSRDHTTGVKSFACVSSVEPVGPSVATKESGARPSAHDGGS